MPWFYYVTRAVVKIALHLFTRWQVKGRENAPRQGSLLIVANHLHLADPPLLLVSLNRKVIFMAKEELFRSRFSRYFISGLGAFPVHRGQLDRQALRQAERILADGLALAMFPEATRSKNAQLQPAFPGSALLAYRSGASILPIGISGTEKIKGIDWWLHRPRITVNIGSPFHLPPVDGKLSRVELVKFTDLIMGHIAELLPVEYQGDYAGKES